MKTTIQISDEEDQEITKLREFMGLPSKRAVVMEGVKALRDLLRRERRRQQMRKASLRVREGSAAANRAWADLSTATSDE